MRLCKRAFCMCKQFHVHVEGIRYFFLCGIWLYWKFLFEYWIRSKKTSTIDIFYNKNYRKIVFCCKKHCQREHVFSIILYECMKFIMFINIILILYTNSNNSLKKYDHINLIFKQIKMNLIRSRGFLWIKWSTIHMILNKKLQKNIKTIKKRINYYNNIKITIDPKIKYQP